MTLLKHFCATKIRTRCRKSNWNHCIFLWRVSIWSMWRNLIVYSWQGVFKRVESLARPTQEWSSGPGSTPWVANKFQIDWLSSEALLCMHNEHSKCLNFYLLHLADLERVLYIPLLLRCLCTISTHSFLTAKLNVFLSK